MKSFQTKSTIKKTTKSTNKIKQTIRKENIRKVKEFIYG